MSLSNSKKNQSNFRLEVKHTILGMLLLTGCMSSPDTTVVDVSNLKFKLGEKVLTNISFFSNCEGTIKGYAKYYDRNTGIYYYSVSFYCPNVGYTDTVYLSEKSFIKRVK